MAQTAAIAVLAIGQLLVILTRGIDLSVGSTLALASVVGAIVYSHGNSGFVVIVVMLATGAAVGFVNGGVYVWGRLPHPFIITLATLSIARGLALQLSGGQPKRGVPPVVRTHRQLVVSVGALLRVARGRNRDCSSPVFWPEWSGAAGSTRRVGIQKLPAEPESRWAPS